MINFLRNILGWIMAIIALPVVLLFVGIACIFSKDFRHKLKGIGEYDDDIDEDLE